MLDIRLASSDEVAEIAAIYDETIDWLESQGIRQWRHGVYPTIDTARAGLADNCLYAVSDGEALVGTLILNEHQDEQYRSLPWQDQNGKVLVLHTLVVRPSATGRGLARQIMAFVLDAAREVGYSSIRLDAFPGNPTATRLYQSLGFQWVGKVYFASKEPGFEWYDCYELQIK